MRDDDDAITRRETRGGLSREDGERLLRAMERYGWPDPMDRVQLPARLLEQLREEWTYEQTRFRRWQKEREKKREGWEREKTWEVDWGLKGTVTIRGLGPEGLNWDRVGPGFWPEGWFGRWVRLAGLRDWVVGVKDGEAR